MSTKKIPGLPKYINYTAQYDTEETPPSDPITTLQGGVLSKKLQKELRSSKVLDFSSLKFELVSVQFLVGSYHLRELDLSRNQLEEFDSATLLSLSKLSHLVINDNRLQAISLYGLSNLRSLFLKNNELTQLQNVESLGKLLYLDLSNNRMERFSDISKISSLRVLDLSRNHIDISLDEFTSFLLEPLKRLKKLKYLSLAKNPISNNVEYLKYYVINQLVSLTYYDWTVISKKDRTRAKTYEQQGIWDSALEIMDQISVFHESKEVHRTQNDFLRSNTTKQVSSTYNSKQVEKLVNEDDEYNRLPTRRKINRSTVRDSAEYSEEDIFYASSVSRRKSQKANTLQRPINIKPSKKREKPRLVLKTSEESKPQRSLTSRSKHVARSTTSGINLDGELSKPMRSTRSEKTMFRSTSSRINIDEDIDIPIISSRKKTSEKLDFNNIIESMEGNVRIKKEPIKSAPKESKHNFEELESQVSAMKIPEPNTESPRTSRGNSTKRLKLRNIELRGTYTANLFEQMENMVADLNTTQASEQFDNAMQSVEIQHAVGKGTFGTSYIGFFNGKTVRAKNIELNDSFEKKNFIQREVKILSVRVVHPRAIKLLGLKDSTYVIQQYITGTNLEDYIKNIGNAFQDSEKLRYLRDIVDIMESIHAGGVIHGSLTPTNIIVSKSGEVWINDYGFLAIKQEIDPEEQNIYFLSPELFNSDLHDAKMDLFSFGMIIYYIFTQEKPFESMSPINVLKAVEAGDRPILQNKIPIIFQKIIIACWNHRTSDRPTFTTLKKLLSTSEDKLLARNNSKDFDHLKTESLPYQLSASEREQADSLMDSLIERLKSNNPRKRLVALNAINQLTTRLTLLYHIPKRPDLLRYLVEFLDSNQPDPVMIALLDAMISLTKYPTFCAIFGQFHSINKLTTCLDTYSADIPVQISILQVLEQMCVVDRLKDRISLDKTIFYIIKFLQSRDLSLIASTLKLLSVALEHRNNMDNFKQQGGLSLLINIGKNRSFQNEVMTCLSNLVSDIEGQQMLSSINMTKNMMNKILSSEKSDKFTGLRCLLKYSKQRGDIFDDDQTIFFFQETINIIKEHSDDELTELSTEIIANFTKKSQYLKMSSQLGLLSNVVVLIKKNCEPKLIVNCLQILQNFMGTSGKKVKAALINIGLTDILMKYALSTDPILRVKSLQLIELLVQDCNLFPTVCSVETIQLLLTLTNITEIEEEIYYGMIIISELTKDDFFMTMLVREGVIIVIAKHLRDSSDRILIPNLFSFGNILESSSVQDYLIDNTTTLNNLLSLLEKPRPNITEMVLQIFASLTESSQVLQFLENTNLVQSIILLTKEKKELTIVSECLKTLFALGKHEVHGNKIRSVGKRFIQQLMVHPDNDIQMKARTLSAVLKL